LLPHDDAADRPFDFLTTVARGVCELQHSGLFLGADFLLS